MDPYLVKIIHIEPEKQIVWHVFPMEGDTFSVFADFSLQPVDGATRFIHRSYSQMRSPKMSGAQLLITQQHIKEANERLENEILFPKLKKFAEQGV